MNRILSMALMTPAMLTSLAPGGEGPADPPWLRVFHASHSFMWYVPGPLAEFAAAARIKDHKQVGLQKIGGSRTVAHWNHARGKNEARKALEAGGVDVFVMSPIQFPDEGVENFVRLGLEHNPKMRFLVQVSWGGADIDNQDFPIGIASKVDREKKPDDLKKLFVRNIKAAEAQADDLNEKYGKGRRILHLVPSAQALVALRVRIANREAPGLSKQDELFTDAVNHPSAPLQALNSYLHYAVLYRRSPVGLPMPDLLKTARKDGWGEKLNTSLQSLAWETATGYPYSGVEVKPR